MPMMIMAPTEPQAGAPAPLWKRLAWFVGLWAAGVAAVAGVAYLLRLWLL